MVAQIRRYFAAFVVSYIIWLGYLFYDETTGAGFDGRKAGKY
jgi:hypothetical protein